MTIYDILFSAGGVEDTIFMSDMYRKRADLIRYNPVFQKMISYLLI